MAKYNRNSFIRGPKLFEGNFLDMNSLPSLRPSVNDEVYTIEEDYNERPDLLAIDFMKLQNYGGYLQLEIQIF